MRTGRVPTLASKTNEKRQGALLCPLHLPGRKLVFSLGLDLLTSTSALPSESRLLNFEDTYSLMPSKNLFTNAQSSELVFQLLEKTGCYGSNHLKVGNCFHSESKPKDFPRRFPILNSQMNESLLFTM